MDFDFTKGFEVRFDGDKSGISTTNWLYSKKHSNEKQAVFLAYDANLYPLPEIVKWKQSTIKETCEKVAEKFKNCNRKVYLDGYLLDMDTKTISKKRL